MTDRSSLGKRIKDLRNQYGVTGKVLAEKTGYSAAAISKFERGILRPTQEFVDKAIRALKLSKSDEIALRELTSLFNSQYQRWSVGSEQIDRNQEMIGQRERNSQMIRSYMNQIIPGLLQTQGYMRAVYRSFLTDEHMHERVIDKLVKVRLKRQTILNDKNRSMLYVLSEGALGTCIGSPEIQREQIKHLETIYESHPSVELRILPFARTLTRFPMHAFVLYDERLVEIETSKGQLDLWTEGDIKYYNELMNLLVSYSYPPLKSRDFLRSYRSNLSARTVEAEL